jgi:hypothetical protein
VSTGSAGFDQVIDGLRLGDNVVWQVDSVDGYRQMVDAFVARSRTDGRRLVYVRFGDHAPLVDDGPNTVTYSVDPTQGFESFAMEVHELAEREGLHAFYVFDCLTELLDHWHSDLMIGNFFKITCPYLYQLDTVAYFALIRGSHTYGTIATIRDTTQLLLDLYQLSGSLYIHPLKVWQRYSPTMFFPHLIRGDEAVSITASSQVADLFSSVQRQGDRLDHWTVAFARAEDALELPTEAQELVKRNLVGMLLGVSGRMAELCLRYFALADILAIASREVGSGRIGGKSVGMLLARKILEREADPELLRHLEPHDSFFIGTDVFYTYVVQNGWWHLRARQRTSEGYYEQAADLREKMLSGAFPVNVREQFIEMLEYFGQSPIIVRSSSLLEDDFGNAFAGKYESVFCVNQGTPEERYEAFEQAVREVYASTMSEEALDYRVNRGLMDRDEQMAILVQRVSGDRHGEDYFPHLAGVGNSENLYIWDRAMDADAGMLRLVFGLGTRAVDRTVGDYARLVCLDDPLRLPPMARGDEKKYSQRGVDVLSLRENRWRSRRFEEVLGDELKADEALFVSADAEAARRAHEAGRPVPQARIVDFRELLTHTTFPQLMRHILNTLEKAYDHPVDVEFTGNLGGGGDLSINVVQCRPLQTRGVGAPVPLPADCTDYLFRGTGNFMGGNVRIPLDYVVYVRPLEYLALGEPDKYAVARHIGRVNAALKGSSVMLLGPGRWGTTTPALGVPLRFAELANMAVIGEVASREAGFSPELSYGSHFFQDLVESGIFYVALPDGEGGIRFHAKRLLDRPNLLQEVAPAPAHLVDVIHVVAADGLEVWSDIATQTVLCV